MANLSISAKQAEFLQSTARVKALICGIGFGKTFIAAEGIVQDIVRGAHVIAMAQTYKALKIVLFEEVQSRLRAHGIPFEINKSDMIIEIPSTGGKLWGFSADAIESVRGVTADKAYLDEAALYTEYVYSVVAGRLRRGVFPYQICITTTPRGQDNWVYGVCQKQETHYIHATTFDNPFLPAEFLEQIALDYDGDFKAQELMGEWVDMGADAQLISIGQIKLAQSRKPVMTDEPKIAGLDVARFGSDSSAFVVRQGNEIPFYRKVNGVSTHTLREMVYNWVVDHGPEVLVIDAVGVGAGVFDELAVQLQSICKVVEFNGAFAANNAGQFANLRAETWHMMRDWLKDNGSLPKGDDFNELASINYLNDSKGRRLMESKDLMRRMGRKSPDIGDAVSMTFGSHAKKSGGEAIKKKLNQRKGRFSG